MNHQLISEFYLTLSRPGDEYMHAGRPEVHFGEGYPGRYTTACGLDLDPMPWSERLLHVTCPKCAHRLYGEVAAPAECPTPEKVGEIIARHMARRRGPYSWLHVGGDYHLMERSTGKLFCVLSTVPEPAPDGQHVLALSTNGRLEPLTPDHPDAQGLEHSWQDVEDLLNEQAKLVAEIAELQAMPAVLNVMPGALAKEEPELAAFALLNGIVHDTRSRGGAQAPDYITHARNVLRWQTVDGNPPTETTYVIAYAPETAVVTGVSLQHCPVCSQAHQIDLTSVSASADGTVTINWHCPNEKAAAAPTESEGQA